MPVGQAGADAVVQVPAEVPEAGHVLYEGQDLKTLDPRGDHARNDRRGELAGRRQQPPAMDNIARLEAELELRSALVNPITRELLEKVLRTVERQTQRMARLVDDLSRTQIVQYAGSVNAALVVVGLGIVVAPLLINIPAKVDGTYTYDPCATRWNASPNRSVPPAILTPSQPPDDHRAATEVPRNSGHPRETWPTNLTGCCGPPPNTASRTSVLGVNPKLAVASAKVPSRLLR